MRTVLFPLMAIAVAALGAADAPAGVFFRDGFESPASATLYFEVNGLTDGRATWDASPGAGRSGRGAIRFTASANGGRASGCGACAWFGPSGEDRVHFRRWIRFSDDYDQGNLHHVGGWLEATSGKSRWSDMGTAGMKPEGGDWFNASFEPWREWGRAEPPGWMFLYVYWPDMERDRDGNWWGNMFQPEPDRRIALKRGRWYCLEHMIKANTPGKADGEIAAWVDGKPYYRRTDLRWRDDTGVRIKRVCFGLYVHRATRANTVWYDDVALSTSYIGP